MSVRSVAWRGWGAFIGGHPPYLPRAGGRGRDGYTLRQRFWASFIGVDLRLACSVTETRKAPPTLDSSRPQKTTSTRRTLRGALEPGWFVLPPLLEAGGLAAAGGDTVVLEASSPDDATMFRVRADHGVVQPEYTLELVLHGVDATRPLVCAVRYPRADGSEQLLLVPVVQGQFGPPASLVRLPGFAAESADGWTASAPVPVTSNRALWDQAIVAVSVHAVLNEATREAWRRVRDLVPDDLGEYIAGELP